MGAQTTDINSNTSLFSSPVHNLHLQPPSLVFRATTWMWLLWPPLIVAMGTVGNVTTVAVLRRAGGRGGGSITVYLLALAWSDLLLLYAGLLRYWVLEVFQVDLYSWSRAVCKMGMWLYGAAWNNSTYLLVALTLQRALSVVWPHRVHVLCTRSRIRAVIGGIGVSSGMLLAHVLYGYDVVEREPGGAGVCGHGSQAYHAFNAQLWVYVEIVTFAFLPFLCLALANGVLAWALAVSVAAAKAALATSDSRQLDARKRKASSTTTTVMAVSVVFIVLNLPLFVLIIVNSSHHIDAPDGGHEGEEEAGQGEDDVGFFLQSFFTILVFCNSAVNFYLYCLTGSWFREQLRMMLSDFLCMQAGNKQKAATNAGQVVVIGDDL